MQHRPRTWSKSDDAKLLAMIADHNTSFREVGSSLGRSESSVYNRLRYLRKKGVPGAKTGMDRMRQQIEGELADRADKLLADAVLIEVGRRNGVPPAVAFDAMATALAALFPDRYTGPAVRGVPRQRTATGDGLARLVRKLQSA